MIAMSVAETPSSGMWVLEEIRFLILAEDDGVVISFLKSSIITISPMPEFEKLSNVFLIKSQ